jgi:hypothetical protein
LFEFIWQQLIIVFLALIPEMVMNTYHIISK